ncbi:helix-turn-helix transcriptional regulator [Candidatus Roizmanbacteria bacterium]|nr:helix-turn-helix transcriptional regulator [Candidatus Roizmanbacteria bacterium]
MRGNFIYKRLGDRIVSERKRKQLSQEQLSILSRVERTYLSRIEKGRANPSVRVLGKLSRVLNTKIYQLLENL